MDREVHQGTIISGKGLQRECLRLIVSLFNILLLLCVFIRYCLTSYIIKYCLFEYKVILN